MKSYMAYVNQTTEN